MKKRIVGLLAVLVVLASLVAIPTSIAGASPTATVSISGTPDYLCMTLTFFDSHDGSWALGTIAESTTYYWDDEGAYPGAAPSFALAIGDCAGNITNCGSGTRDITAECADFTGGDGWNLDVGAPGSGTVQVTCYFEGCANEAAGIELDNAPVDVYEDLATSTSIGVELSLETGTFTDGAAKASTGVVFVITAAD